MRRPWGHAVVVALVASTVGVVAPSSPAGASGDGPVTVDIRPGTSGAEKINAKSQGVPPVAVLSDGDFDAGTLAGGRACFGDADNAEQHDCTESHGTAHYEDVDSDSNPRGNVGHTVPRRTTHRWRWPVTAAMRS